MNISFGKYRGQSIDSILASDPQYLIWITTKNFEPTRKRVSQQIEHIKTLVAPLVVRDEAIKKATCAARVDALAPAARALKSAVLKKSIRTGYTSQWCMSIIASLETGNVLSIRAREIVADICGKAAGRRNSKKYIEARSVVDSAFATALAITLNNIDE